MAIETTGNDLVVIASDPKELAEGQHALVAKVRQKLAELGPEVEQAEAALLAADEANIETGALKRILNKHRDRGRYLEKVALALEAGYLIVPNFPGDTVAIRVKQDRRPRLAPNKGLYKHTANASPETGDLLPAGEGHYVDPNPIQEVSKLPPPEPGKTQQWLATPVEFDEQFALPVEFLKPTVIQRTGKCMARKIFDEVAIAPASGWRGGDPMVLGRILLHRRRWAGDSSVRMLTFLVAWFQDTSEI
jgi:hypothetical protein